MTRPRQLLFPVLLVLAGCTVPADHADMPQAVAQASTGPGTPGRPGGSLEIDHLDPGDVAVPLPDAISRALQTDPLVLDCPMGVSGGRSRFGREWVGVHRVDLDADGSPEWILNGLHRCLRQQEDGHAYWWIYAGGEPGAMRVLARALQGRTLEVLPGAGSGMPDLRMHLVNGRGAPLQLDLASDGTRYVPAARVER